MPKAEMTFEASRTNRQFTSGLTSNRRCGRKVAPRVCLASLPTRVLQLVVAMLLTIAMLSPVGVARDMSLACVYNIMTEEHQIMALCGEPLDQPTEVKYQELRAALKKYINENALSDEHRIGPDYDERRAPDREKKFREGFCNRPEYQIFKANLLRFLHNEQE